MTFHKQKQYDPTEAFLLNERQQKLLILKLDTIDKLWYSKLKLLSKNRLEATTEMMKLEDEKQQLAYYDINMEVRKMKGYNDECIRQMTNIKRELSHDNFNFDLVAQAHRKRPVAPQQGILQFPKLPGKHVVTQSSKGKKRTNTKGGKKQRNGRTSKVGVRRQSNLMKSRIFSVSDSNLDRMSKSREKTVSRESTTLSMSHEDLSNNTRVNHFINKVAAANAPNSASPTLLPTIAEKKAPPEDHRYLKQRMVTSLALPTVNEVVQPRQRKLSV